MRTALVLAALALAGCAEPAGFGFSSGEALREPYYKEHREILSGQHARDFDVPVDDDGARANVTISLDARRQGLPLPEASPSRITARLLDPTGALLAEATLDAREPTASILAEELAAGVHTLHVEGYGLSQELDGDPYGAAYLVAIEILYE